VTDTVWSEAERLAWAPPDRVSVSTWADKYRVLPAGVTSEPGPWRTDRVPYLGLLMDVMGDGVTQEVVFMKSPQVGGSEATRNAIGFWADQDPGPCLIVYPSEQSAKEAIDERILPMIKSTEQLHRHVTGVVRDLKQTQVNLRTMSIYAAHAGSPQSLASRPCRYVVCDEVDKYPAFSGREADPVNLAEARTRTYGHRRKLVLVSTPTTKHGAIAMAFDATPGDAQFHYHLACPHCQALQPLTFSRLRWGTGHTPTAGGPVPDDEQTRSRYAAEVQAGGVPVWYACVKCEGRLEEAHKHKALGQGQWRSKEDVPFQPGFIRVAFHISSLYSPWVMWSRVVAEYLRSRIDHAAMMNFMNNWLGLPFEEELNKLEASLFEQKVKRFWPKGVVPAWARYVIASADVGGRDAWFMVRAWGAGYRSQLLDWGHCSTLEELKARTLGVVYPVKDLARSAQPVDLLLIDTGGTYDVDNPDQSRTDQIYKFTLTDRRIVAVKGNIKLERAIAPRNVTYKPPNGESPYSVHLHHLNVHYFKDVLAERLTQSYAGSDLWLECQGIDEDYVQHMTAEHRVLERVGRQSKMMWRPLAKGVPNHLWDCAVYQCAGADMVRVDMLGEAKAIDGAPEVEVKAVRVIGATPTTRPWLASRRPR
jgi:phage terminase large subunit GpA-like protein